MKKTYISPINRVHVLMGHDAILTSASGGTTGDNLENLDNSQQSSGGDREKETGTSGGDVGYARQNSIWSNEW